MIRKISGVMNARSVFDRFKTTVAAAGKSVKKDEMRVIAKSILCNNGEVVAIVALITTKLVVA